MFTWPSEASLNHDATVIGRVPKNCCAYDAPSEERFWPRALIITTAIRRVGVIGAGGGVASSAATVCGRTRDPARVPRTRTWRPPILLTRFWSGPGTTSVSVSDLVWRYVSVEKRPVVLMRETTCSRPRSSTVASLPVVAVAVVVVPATAASAQAALTPSNAIRGIRMLPTPGDAAASMHTADGNSCRGGRLAAIGPSAQPVTRARPSLERVGSGDVAVPFRTGLGCADERLSVHGDQTELRPIAERPLEVVQQRPVEVAAHVDAVGEASPDAFECVAHVCDATLVVVVSETVLGDVQRRLRDLGGVPNRDLERLGPELVTHRGDDLDAVLGSHRPALLVQARPRVRLD